MATRYGKLTVPTNDIIRIDLGCRLPERAAEKIDKAIKQQDYAVIKTSEFVIVGGIEDLTLKAKTTYFGEVKLDLADVCSLRSLAHTQETEVSVEAAKYYVCTRGSQWLDTGVEVAGETELTITASGKINVDPHRGQIGISGPAGNPTLLAETAFGHPIGALLGASARRASFSWSVSVTWGRRRPEGNCICGLPMGPVPPLIVALAPARTR